MNDIKLNLHSKEYHLLFNGYAMFAERELFGGKQIIEAVQEDNLDGFNAVCTALHLLSEQGELARRYEGFEKNDIPDVDMLRVKLTPADIPQVKLAIINAILKGYGREIQDDEVDLGLAEIQKKRKKPLQKRST